MTEKSDKIFGILLRIFTLIAAFGLIILIVTNYGKNPSDVAFSLIAFIISVAALLMTTLQSASIAHQVRITTRATRIVKESADQLATLIKEERLLEKEIRRDIAMDQEIVGVLEEYGVGDNKDERQKVAVAVAKKVHQITKEPKD